MALTDLDSIPKRLVTMEAGGILARSFQLEMTATTTAGNTTSGFYSFQRYPAVFTVPSVTGYTGWEMMFSMYNEDSNTEIIAGLEFDLGVLTVSSNTFAAGTDSAVPTGDTRIDGTSYTAEQMAAVMPMLFVSSALTATTPVITTTYVNEDGTGSRTCTMTLPTNAALNTAFAMVSHLDTGDTAIQDVTNMSKSAGTAGELRVKGLIPLGTSYNSNATFSSLPFIRRPRAPVIVTSGQKIAFYRTGNTTTTNQCIVDMWGRPI